MSQNNCPAGSLYLDRALAQGYQKYLLKKAAEADAKKP